MKDTAAPHAESPKFTHEFTFVQAAETQWIAERRRAAGQPAPTDDLVGLAFSGGGGIRSATFNLGVMQALDHAGLSRQIDYLSSVSGGGFVASSYTWLRATAAQSATAPFELALQNGHGRVIDSLRAHGKYLIAHKGFSAWTLAAAIIAASLLNLIVLGPLLLLSVYALTLAWLPVAWPSWLVLAGQGAINDHHGYWLLLASGCAAFALFPLFAIIFAFLVGVPGLFSARRILVLRETMGQLLYGGLVLLALGMIPIADSAGEALARMLDTRFAGGFERHVPYVLSMLSGASALWAGNSAAKNGREQLAIAGLALLVYGLLLLAYHLAVHVGVVGSYGFFALTALALLLAMSCDLNAVSMHFYYRSRLGEAFMPRVAGGTAVDPMQFRVADVHPGSGAPLHLINTTLNTTSSSNPQLRSRQGASFFFSPVYTGSQATGFRRSDDYARGRMSLATAMTISGAAVDPDMFATRARPVSFLMALLNIRLGYWAANPHNDPSRMSPPLPWWWIQISRDPVCSPGHVAGQ